MTNELIKAAQNGDVARLQALLEPFDRERASEALVYAAIHGRLGAARLLLERGADPNRRASYGQTALFFATSSLPMVELLLSFGADVHARRDGGHDVLHHYLISVGPGPRLRSGDVQVVQRLLDAGLDVRARNADAPHLLLACQTAVPAIVEALLAAGADPNARTRDSNALWAALLLPRRAEMFALLVRGGLDPNFRCTNAATDTTILMEVCRGGDLETARRLLDLGADPNAGGKGTPLSCAEESGNRPLVDLLLERGARSHQPTFESSAARALDEAERNANAHPDDARARLAWAGVLLANAFRAAAASEVSAARRLGIEVPVELADRLAFERPAGVRWTFVKTAFDGVAPRTSDARFPGSCVTDGTRTLPLVVTLGTPCTGCDEHGEQVCSLCNGTGSYTSFLDPDHDVDCGPRQLCSTCRGLKFAVTGQRFGKGSCRHPTLVDELRLGRFSLRRCTACGLAALHGPVRAGGVIDDDFACGVCGQFECRCSA